MLLAMAVFDTLDNDRSWMTEATLDSLNKTVCWDRHELIVSDNGSCEQTQALYERMQLVFPFRVIRNGKNIGTANAINRAWSHAYPDESVVKIDNDVIIHNPNWADMLEECFARDPKLGIVGLKRKDLLEYPGHDNAWFCSTIKMLPHEPGERWHIVEYCPHVMGTCQAYRPELREKLGYLYQMGSLYGFDDALASCRAHVAGFNVGFLNGIEIDHIDPGGTDFTKWKQEVAGQYMHEFYRTRDGYNNGTLSIYYDGGELLQEYIAAAVMAY